MAAIPLLIVPLAHFFVPGEPLTLSKALGFGLGFLGVLVLIGPDAFLGETSALPRLACLGAACCYAVSSIILRRCPPIDPLVLAATSLSIGSAALIPSMLLVEGLPRLATPLPMAAIIILGLVPTAFATLLRVQVVRSAGPSSLSLVNYQVPLWSAVFGLMVLNESLSPGFFAALALILSGLALSQRIGMRKTADIPLR
jgi:drug/metabolite transporter (DMT)-like permease